jgi:hypothetical protein
LPDTVMVSGMAAAKAALSAASVNNRSGLIRGF